jgi:hypothetical protein
MTQTMYAHVNKRIKNRFKCVLETIKLKRKLHDLDPGKEYF